ncbi:MAG: acyl-CoA dehydratase activase-related protein [Nanoarchaeota archaeon]|nr:acyl-CoA dehydratase activase-related protein [Nanoarchaeota archaeon]
MKKGIMKIGIPRALMFFEYGKKWERFFKELGFEVVVSPDTDNEIYDEGLKNTLTDYCLPIKVFIGHVLWLKDKCDIVFIPRIRSSEEWIYHCPNIIGVPDLVKNSIEGVKILDVDFRDDLESYQALAKKLGKGDIKKIYEKLKNLVEVNVDFFKNKTVALVGRSYYLFDNKLNLDMKKKLKDYGYDVVTNINPKNVEKLTHWTNVNKLIASIKKFNSDDKISGIIYIKPFNCGPDFIVEELVNVDKPMLVLRLDEHSSETGLITRLEAFTDIL